MASSYFSTFTKSCLAFHAIYKLSLKINEGTAYIGSSLKLRFQSGIFNMMLQQPPVQPPLLARDGELPLSSLIFSDLLYTSPITSHGGRMTDEILTIREVAELLKINEKTAYKLASAGKIPGFKVGGSWRFQRQEIASWIKRKVEEQQGSNGE